MARFKFFIQWLSLVSTFPYTVLVLMVCLPFSEMVWFKWLRVPKQFGLVWFQGKETEVP